MTKKCGIIPFTFDYFAMYGEFSFKQFMVELIEKFDIDTFCLTSMTYFEHEIYYDLTHEIKELHPEIEIDMSTSWLKIYNQYKKEYEKENMNEVYKQVYKNLINYCDLIIFVNPNYHKLASGEIGQIVAKKLCKIYKAETIYSYAQKYAKNSKKKLMLFSPKVINYNF